MYWYIIFHGNDTIHSNYFKTFHECKRNALLHCFCYDDTKVSVSIFKNDLIIQDIDINFSVHWHSRDWSY